MKYIAILIIALGSYALKAQTARISGMSKASVSPHQKTIQQHRRDNHGEILNKILENNKRLNSLPQSLRIVTGKQIGRAHV